MLQVQHRQVPEAIHATGEPGAIDKVVVFAAPSDVGLVEPADSVIGTTPGHDAESTVEVLKDKRRYAPGRCTRYEDTRRSLGVEIVDEPLQVDEGEPLRHALYRLVRVTFGDEHIVVVQHQNIASRVTDGDVEGP